MVKSSSRSIAFDGFSGLCAAERRGGSAVGHREAALCRLCFLRFQVFSNLDLTSIARCGLEDAVA